MTDTPDARAAMVERLDRLRDFVRKLRTPIVGVEFTHGNSVAECERCRLADDIECVVDAAGAPAGAPEPVIPDLWRRGYEAGKADAVPPRPVAPCPVPDKARRALLAYTEGTGDPRTAQFYRSDVDAIIRNIWAEAPCPPAAPEPSDRPKVVCLCGSTRFYDTFQRANYEETMAGRIVLSVGFYPHALQHHEGVGITAAEKVALDELHKRKIDLADEVLVLNVGGYIGDSTRSEIAYAEAHGKPVRYLESGAPPERGTAAQGEDGR